MDKRIAPTIDSELCQRVLDHLHQEQAFWTQALATLHTLRQMLAVGQWHELGASLFVQSQLTEESERLRQVRRHVCMEAARALGLAESCTLEQIALRLPTPHQEAALRLRDSLRAGALGVQRLGQTCAVLANCHVEFIHRLFADLTGSTGTHRYGPAGTLRPGVCRPLLQARG